MKGNKDSSRMNANISAFAAYNGEVKSKKNKNKAKNKQITYKLQKEDYNRIESELQAAQSFLKKDRPAVIPTGTNPSAKKKSRGKKNRRKKAALNTSQNQKEEVEEEICYVGLKRERDDDDDDEEEKGEMSFNSKKAKKEFVESMEEIRSSKKYIPLESVKTPLNIKSSKKSLPLKKDQTSTKKYVPFETVQEYPTSTQSSIKKKGKMDNQSENGSIEDGRKDLEWMINPIDVDSFFKDTFEAKPIFIKRKNSKYYSHLFSTQAFDKILRDEYVLFGKNLDVTSFSNDVRETHNPEGRAYPSVVWDLYNNDCSIRMLNPQTFNYSVWKLCASLQEFFGSMVGANLYLTPPGTQGFAPHYDDVEVFILQLEGKKRWRVYDPPYPLPRFPSKNFSQSEVENPVLDVIVEAGDMLYMPRGTIHQGNCLEDKHSLHLTISCHQLNSFGDLLKEVVPAAIEAAMEQDVEFRRGLPKDYFRYMGAVNSDESSLTSNRTEFKKRIENLMKKLFTYAPVDDGVDRMAKRFLHQSLPPVLTEEERVRTVYNGGERWHSKKQRVVNRVEFDPDTRIRLLRANCARIVREDDESVKIYYNVENTRQYEEISSQFLEVEDALLPAVDLLFSRYPEYVSVEELPVEDDALKFSLVQNLWEKKLIMTQYPLEAHYDD